MKIAPPRSSVWLVALLLLCAVGKDARATDWTSDYSEAVAKAKATHKNILMDFTGSDWCEFCIKMDKEVINTKEFESYADKNLVLMLVDFPQGKQLPQKVQDQNAKLQEKYGVEGFPTFILTDEHGKVLTQNLGYLEGGPKAFIAKFSDIKK